MSSAGESCGLLTEQPCRPATTAVLIVHGIGVQNRGDTLDEYGGAIARLWTEFQTAGRRFESFRCDAGHLHLGDPSVHGRSAAVLDEAWWEDQVLTPPPVYRQLAWLLTVTPIMVLYSLCRLPRIARPTVLSLQRPARTVAALSVWAMRVLALLLLWLFRIGASLLVIGVLQIGICAVTVLLCIAGLLVRRSRPTIRMIRLTLADAHGFARDPVLANRMIAAVVRRAENLIAESGKLVVVAHSQGGAITYEAVQRSDWPPISTNVVTLGSGHKRLILLRRITEARMGNLFATGFSAVLTLFGLAVLTVEVPWLRAAVVASQRSSGWVGLIAYPVAIPALVAIFALGRVVGSSIRFHTDSWCDIWSSLDLVPDGPLSSAQVPNTRVRNGSSIFADHTSYQQNAIEVVAPIVRLIDSTRISTSDEALERMKTLRQRRLLWDRRWAPSASTLVLAHRLQRTDGPARHFADWILSKERVAKQRALEVESAEFGGDIVVLESLASRHR